MEHGTTQQPGRRRGVWLLVLAVGLLGAVLVGVGVVTQHPDAARLDQPIGTVDAPEETRTASPEAGAPDKAPEVRAAQKVPLGPSEPIAISIPAIDVTSEVFPLGKAVDGTLEVPQPGPRLDLAAWYEDSPTPGQPGPAVIEGHVATDEGGPSVFFDLAELRPGDTISVKRRDGRTAVFTVDALREFAKDAFPTELVYGGNISEPTLRLITCSNFDPSVGSHTANLLVFASLTEVLDA